MTKKLDSAPRKKPIQHLVIHSFALTPQKMLTTLRQYQLSVHYLIDAKGKIYALVPEEKVAWHAGPSFWAGEAGLNQTSVGIELEHSDYGQTEYPKIQIDALKKLAKEIIKHYQIRPENIVGHSDIAPEAKMDPGRGLPWKELAATGIGLWYDLKDSEKLTDLSVTKLLSLIGYKTEEQTLKASVWAFRRHFMPKTVPYDKEIAKREKEIFEARQKKNQLPPIYPPNLDITAPDFIEVLRAVAWRYQQARKR